MTSSGFFEISIISTILDEFVVSIEMKLEFTLSSLHLFLCQGWSNLRE